MRILHQTAVPPCPNWATSAAHTITDEERRYRCPNRTAPFRISGAATTPPWIPRAGAGGLPPRPRWCSSAGPVGRLADGGATDADSAVGERRRRGRAGPGVRGALGRAFGGGDPIWLSDHNGAAVQVVRADTSRQLLRAFSGTAGNVRTGWSPAKTYRSPAGPRGCATHSTDRQRPAGQQDAGTPTQRSHSCEPQPGPGSHSIPELRRFSMRFPAAVVAAAAAMIASVGGGGFPPDPALPGRHRR